MGKKIKPRARKRKYHHGDLGRALVEAGLALVESDGIDALSLRGVARRAKVSHAAPYHHFQNKAELLAAVAAAGFDRLVGTIDKELADGKPSTPLDQLRAIGRGYMLFAADHPTVFRLMFRPELTRPADHPLLLAAEARAFGLLHQTIMAAQQVGQLPAGEPCAFAAFAWSTVHGLAMLHVEQVLKETPLGQVPFASLVDQVNELCVRGLKSLVR